MTKVIKQEVFDISDTMDIMAKVIKRQEKLLEQQSSRISHLEKALNKAGVNEEEQEEYMEEEAPDYKNVNVRTQQIT